MLSATGQFLRIQLTLKMDIPLLVLDLGLDIVDGVRGLNLEGDGFTRKAVEGARSVKVDLNVEGCRAYVLTKICIPPRRRKTRWRVDSF